MAESIDEHKMKITHEDGRRDGRFINSGINLFYISLSFFAAFYISLVPLRGGDFWLLAKIGDISLQTIKIPDTLLFPFTEMSGEHYNAHEWLSAVVFSILNKYFDKHNLTFVAGGLGLMFFVSLVLLSIGRNRENYALTLLCSILALLCENYRHVIRPELLSLIITSFYWLILERIAHNPRNWHYVAASLLVILWSNIHGSFPIAFVLSAIYSVGFLIDYYTSIDSNKSLSRSLSIRFAVLTVVFVISSCVNPYGTELLLFATKFGIHSDVHAYITEWLPTFSEMWLSQSMLWLLVFFWSLVLAAFLSIRSNLRAVDWLAFIFITVISIKAIRFPIYMCFLLAMYLPKAVIIWFPSLKKPDNSFRWVGFFSTIVIVVCSGVGNPMGFRPLVDREFSKISTKMENFLKSSTTSGNVLNSMELGGELVYLGYPRLRPAIDGRLDSYGLSYYQFIANAVYKPEYFPEFVERYNVKYIFLTNENFDGFKTLPGWKSGDWGIVDADSYSILLKRKNLF